MNRKYPFCSSTSHLGITFVVLFVCCFLLRCALSGTVVNQGEFETTLSDIRLEGDNSIKVYCGGSSRKIPLKNINTITINPAVSVTIDDELYFNADITLKDGTRIQSINKDRSIKTEVFVCVHHELIGKLDGEKYTAGFEHILRLTVQ